MSIRLPSLLSFLKKLLTAFSYYEKLHGGMKDATIILSSVSHCRIPLIIIIKFMLIKQAYIKLADGTDQSKTTIE